MRSEFFAAALCAAGCTAQQCDPPEASAVAKADYEACMEEQGSWGNWKVTQRCVGAFRSACIQSVADAKFCSVTRSTKYTRGVCLPAACPEGSCTGAMFGPCTDTKAAQLALFGSMDETDTAECCEAAACIADSTHAPTTSFPTTFEESDTYAYMKEERKCVDTADGPFSADVLSSSDSLDKTAARVRDLLTCGDVAQDKTLCNDYGDFVYLDALMASILLRDSCCECGGGQRTDLSAA